MAKLTLQDISAGYSSTTTINANNALIEAALENTLSLDGTSPNAMTVDLDLNSNKITNLADGTNNQDAVTLAQLTAASDITTGTAALTTIVDSGGYYTGTNVEAALQELGAGGAEVNDLSAAVTWANIPDANVPESAVTQHEAAITITESQISDLGTYETADAAIAKTDENEVVTGHWNVPSTINTQNGNYTLVLGDAGKTIRKASGGAGETITIPANASVAIPVGTFVGFDNEGGGAVTIAINTDTLIFADDGTTGSRTLADSGYAVAQKVATTTWKIAGKQLT